MVSVSNKRFDEIKALGFIPSPCGIATKLMELMGNPEASAQQLADLVQIDPAISGRLLKAANSTLFSGRYQSKTVREAIVRIGFQASLNISLAFALVDRYRKKNPSDKKGFNHDEFWSHCLATAIAAKHIAERFRLAPAEEAFTCGLLVRIGMIVLATIHEERYSEILEQAQTLDLIGRIHLEREEFAIDYRELSEAILADWGLPESYSHAALTIDEENLDQIYAEPSGLESALSFATLFANYATSDEILSLESATEIRNHLFGKSLQNDYHEFLGKILADWKEWGKILEIPTEILSSEYLTLPPEPGDPATSVGTGIRVLVVDDDPLIRTLLTRILTSKGHSVLIAVNGKQALSLALTHRPQMVITDWLMPEMDGLEFCRLFRKTKFGRKVYIVLLTATTNEDSVTLAFDAGINDMMTKPFQIKSLLARIAAGRRVISLYSEVMQDREHLRRAMAELSVANRKLEQAAFTDVLTGLINRRCVLELFEQQWASSSRTGEPLSIAIFDIDEFKKINDTLGHVEADGVLRQISSILKSNSRRSNLVARYGGEEFLILCPSTTMNSAFEYADRLRGLIEKECRNRWPGISVTISAGVAEKTSKEEDIDSLIRIADAALYEAKQLGRNQVRAGSSSKQY